MDKAQHETVDFQEQLFSLQNTPMSLEAMSLAWLFYSRPVCNLALPEIVDGRDEHDDGESFLKEKGRRNKN